MLLKILYYTLDAVFVLSVQFGAVLFSALFIRIQLTLSYLVL